MVCYLNFILKLPKFLTYKSFGERAVLVEWEAVIDEEILSDIVHFKNKIHPEFKELEECVIGYNSLTLIFKSAIFDFNAIRNKLERIYSLNNDCLEPRSVVWKIPVCYDTSYGLDIEEVSLTTKLSIEEIIKRHTEPQYLVYFIGFLPGFLYLGGLDTSIHINRKVTPRLKIPSGSVAIGGSQTGVYPMESPGGWNIIGRTPVPFFSAKEEVSCFASSGDRVQFYAITKEEFTLLENRVKVGEFEIESLIAND